jgi:tRNA-dihydrouridine synthase C
MPWADVVTLLQKYSRLEKQGDTGLYHVARIKQWLSYLRKNTAKRWGYFRRSARSRRRLILRGFQSK